MNPNFLSTVFLRVVRKEAEQEPVIVLSCILGGVGILLPLLLGDGGRRKEIEASTYAYRMKYLYPEIGRAHV